MDNHRTAPRHRTLKTATIEFGGGAISCVIRNISENGAMLDVTSPVGIPECFSLVPATEDRRYPCRVVWRKEKRIGVTFE